MLGNLGSEIFSMKRYLKKLVLQGQLDPGCAS